MGLFSKTPTEMYQEASALMDNSSTYKKGWNKMVKAAEKGDRTAQCVLASRYYIGDADLNLKQDFRQSLEWYRKSAEQLFPYAMSMTAYFCHDGKGMQEDLKECIAWLQYMTSKGLGETPLDWTDAGTDENGNCIPYTAEQFLKKAMNSLAENLDAEELCEFGRYFDSFTGLGVNSHLPDFGGIKKSEGQTAYWYMKAALKGNADAQNCMGIIIQLGKGGFDADIFEAVRWYMKAAKQGHKKALQTLDDMCKNNDMLARRIKAIDEDIYNALCKKREDEMDAFLDELFQSESVK